MKLQVSRWGNSLAVRLPVGCTRATGLKEGDSVEATVTPAGSITLTPACASIRQERVFDAHYQATRYHANDRTRCENHATGSTLLIIYVDTSVIVTLLTVEPRTQDVTAWHARLDDTPTCSDWLLTEFFSALSIKRRAGQISETNAKRVHEEFEILANGGLRIAPISREAFRHAGEMIKQHDPGLRAGDFLHLAIALELGASHIATLDENLAAV